MKILFCTYVYLIDCFIIIIASFTMIYIQVTKRVNTDENVWSEWNWRTEGDVLVNGAFFVPSGASRSVQYAKATSVEPRSAYFVNQLTMGAGVLGGPRYVKIISTPICAQIHTHTHSNILNCKNTKDSK